MSPSTANPLVSLRRVAYGVCCMAMVMGQKSANHPLRFADASGLLDRALAATAWWLAMKGSDSIDRRLRRLIELGASPSVQNWLPVRMAACAGRADTICWLAERSRPSSAAINDALAWAQRNRHVAAVSALEALQAIKV